ncbi:hypothetical protein [uncultured Tenacibaculum sp.]|uniref:hypothetical protein n=1 Tax=uncultured Tenacibaculum sp. TaxID=174713 RepID=UPI00261143E7|nr:hypothetical protein [uncultured Tenacibaculum sp.]
MSDQHHKENEEVDLGSLFIIIGKGFSKLFSFIGSIFKAIFSFLINSLLFLKANIIKLAVATIVGGATGIFFEYKSGTKYVADLYVKPNFGSARQLYNNIQFYDDLVKQKLVDQKNNTDLSKIFNITPEDAESLKKFTIQPVINENDILTSFDELMQSVDTSTVKSYSYRKFKETFTEVDYKVHRISVISSKNDVFQKLSTPIISSIVNNDYFKTLKGNNKKSLLETDALLRKNLQQTDSLHNLYKKVLLEEAKKLSPGTSISLQEKGNASNKELQLFNTSLRLNKELIEVNDDLSEKSEIINIVSNFQPIGHKVKEIQKNKGFQFGIIGLFLMILGLLLLKLNSYLDTHKNKKKF